MARARISYQAQTCPYTVRPACPGISAGPCVETGRIHERGRAARGSGSCSDQASSRARFLPRRLSSREVPPERRRFRWVGPRAQRARRAGRWIPTSRTGIPRIGWCASTLRAIRSGPTSGGWPDRVRGLSSRTPAAPTAASAVRLARRGREFLRSRAPRGGGSFACGLTDRQWGATRVTAAARSARAVDRVRVEEGGSHRWESAATGFLIVRHQIIMIPDGYAPVPPSRPRTRPSARRPTGFRPVPSGAAGSYYGRSSQRRGAEHRTLGGASPQTFLGVGPPATQASPATRSGTPSASPTCRRASSRTWWSPRPPTWTNPQAGGKFFKKRRSGCATPPPAPSPSRIHEVPNRLARSGGSSIGAIAAWAPGQGPSMGWSVGWASSRRSQAANLRRVRVRRLRMQRVTYRVILRAERNLTSVTDRVRLSAWHPGWRSVGGSGGCARR